MHNPHALDLLDGEGFNLLLFVAHQTQATYPTAIRETNVLAIRLELPTRLFVFYRTVIVLELGIAFPAGFMVFAVVIEAGNRAPGSISRGLASLGIQTGGKGILVGKGSTVALEIILGDSAPIHPLAQALVPDELHDANGVINGGVLLGAPVEFVLLNEHPLALSGVGCYT